MGWPWNTPHYLNLKHKFPNLHPPFAGDWAFGDVFGQSVAISGDVVVGLTETTTTGSPLYLILISGRQPLDVDQFLDRFKLGVPGQNQPLMALSHGRAEGVGVGNRVFGLDFSGLADQQVVHRKNINRELIEQGQGLLGFIVADPSVKDIVEFPPVWSIDGGGTINANAGKYSLIGTIRQPDAGDMSVGGNTRTGGYWCQGTLNRIYLPLIIRN